MARLILFNKPYGVICQFSPHEKHPSLKDYLPIADIYPAGRLDHDSEGLLLLTDDGGLQHRISHPKNKMPKTYWAQLDDRITDAAIQQLRQGVQLKDGMTKPARVQRLEAPGRLWPREPPIRVRQQIPTSWIEITIREGRNRQVRRMTAAVGFPTLRLIRVQVGEWQLGDLQPGEYRELATD